MIKGRLKGVAKAAALCVTALCVAAEPLVWERRPNRPAPAQFDTFHGETLDFRCTFAGFGALPFSEGSDVRLWYQTNGMGAAWWSVPATVASNVVSAAWPPSADPGANRVSFFFGAPSNAYAAAQVRFRNSPGAHPNDLDPPSILDWQAELAAATNALWESSAAAFMPQSNAYTKSETDARIEQLAPRTSLAPSTNYTDEAVLGLAGSIQDGSLIAQNAFEAEVAESLLGGGGVPVSGADVMASLATKTTTNDVCNIVTNEVAVGFTEWVFTCDVPEIQAALDAATSIEVSISIMPSGLWALSVFGLPQVDGWVLDETFANTIIVESPDVESFTAYDGVYSQDNYSVRVGFTATRERIVQNALGLATMKDLEGKADASITNDIGQLKTESTLVYRLFSGSNIVMEVTNYNSRVNPPATKLMRLNDKGIYEVVWTETNGLERTYNRAASNTAEQVAALEKKAAETYAPRGWSATTSGLGADAPMDTTWISTPTTVIAGGLEYSKAVTSSGQLWFLRSNGMVVNMGGNSGGYFDISASDGTSVFSIEKTDSYMAPVDADGISVNGNTVTIRLSVVSADHPLLRYAPTLNAPVEWQKEEDGFSSPIAVSWTGSSGAWVAIVTTTAKKGFFQFEFFQEGSTKIKNGGAMDVSAGGILCTDGIHKCRPVWSNGTITWEAF